jgi:hypothetical protein
MKRPRAPVQRELGQGMLTDEALNKFTATQYLREVDSIR